MNQLDSLGDRVAHIADIHFWRLVFNPLRMMNKRFFGNLTVLMRRRLEFATENAESFGDAVAATGVKSVILTGDFTSTSLQDEFEMAARFVRGLRDRGMAIHLMPGNHDAYTLEARRARRFERCFAEFIPPEGYPALRRLSGGTSLILVPGVCPRYLTARGRVTRDEIEAVSGLLKKCGPRVIVAAHYPVLNRTHGYSSHPFRRLTNAEVLREALAASGKKILYVCGHVHRFSYERDKQYPNIEYLSMGGFLHKNHKTGVDGEFAEIHTRENGFTVMRHTHRQEWNAGEETPR